MPSWTAADLPDQSGRRVVVTGANTGIGFHAARELAAHGADVTLAVRSTEKGHAAADRIRAQHPDAAVEVRPLDLADLASVRSFAADLPGDLDLLVNNAGVMALPRRETADGFELQFGTNHLGHFALTGLLLPKLLATARPRVTTVSSGAHKIGKIRFDDLQGERRYQRWMAYGQSKLSNLLFALELSRRAAAAGTELRSTAAHPGYAATELQRRGAEMDGNPVKVKLTALMNRVIAQPDEAGAWPTLYAATADVPSGTYIGPDGPAEMRGHPHVVSPNGAAQNEDVARRLWEVSSELTGVTYDFSVPAAV